MECEVTKHGSHDLPVPRVIAAPMAGVTDLPFRLFQRQRYGGLAFAEMLSAEAVVRDNPQTRRMSAMDSGPTGVQLVGSNPSTMARAAVMLVDSGAVVVDINAGCPDPHVVKKGGGAALMKDPGALRGLVEALGANVEVPVTVKTRSGWSEENLEGLADALHDSGAAWVTFHPRTAKERYSARADHSRTARFVELMGKTPVIASGDILTEEDALGVLEAAGVKGVMAARGMMGDPLFPWRMDELLKGRNVPRPDIRTRCGWLVEHASLSAQCFGEEVGLKRMRKHAFWYLKGVPKRMLPWREINSMVSMDELRSIYRKVLSEF